MLSEPNIATNTYFVDKRGLKDVLGVFLNPHIVTITALKMF